MKRIMLLFGWLCCFAAHAGAEQADGFGKKYPPDTELDQCRASPEAIRYDGETIRCYLIAAQNWDVILNQEYQLLYASASPEARKSLKKSERAWRHYRDSHNHFVNMYYEQDESLSKFYPAFKKLELNRYKAIALILERKNKEKTEFNTYAPDTAGTNYEPLYLKQAQWDTVIDPATQACLKQQTGAICYAQAEKKWDAELKKEYKALYNIITNLKEGYNYQPDIPELQKRLKRSQDAWIKYRQSYNEFLHDYYHLPGKQWRDAQAKSRMRVVENRVKKLKLVWGYTSVYY